MANADINPALRRTDSYALLADDSGGTITINLTTDPVRDIEGCPVPEQGPPCCRNCGGGWPGLSSLTTEKLTQGVYGGAIKNTNNACGPVSDRIAAALHEIDQGW